MAKIDALDEFFEEVREVDYLLSSEIVEKSLPAPDEKVDERKRTGALCRASLVMLVAHFEGFIKASLAEFVDAVRQARPPSRRVPGALLEMLTRERIREIASVEERAERVRKTRRLFSVYGKLWDEDRSVDPNLLSPKVLSRKLSNAGPEAINEVLGLLEVENAIGKVQEDVQGSGMSDEMDSCIDVSARLEGIVKMRNQIAHGNLNIVPAASDVKSDLHFMSSVATSIAKIISDKVDICCSLR